MTESERFGLDLAKIERRLDRDDLEEDQRECLWDLREQLFTNGVVADLDCLLREITRRRS